MWTLLKINERRYLPQNAMLWKLFHSGKLTIDGREVRLGSRKLPTPTVRGDAVIWTFGEPVKVDTPGPDSSVTEIRQYRDRIEITVWPWADITIATT